MKFQKIIFNISDMVLSINELILTAEIDQTKYPVDLHALLQLNSTTWQQTKENELIPEEP